MPAVPHSLLRALLSSTAILRTRAVSQECPLNRDFSSPAQLSLSHSQTLTPSASSPSGTPSLNAIRTSALPPACPLSALPCALSACSCSASSAVQGLPSNTYSLLGSYSPLLLRVRPLAIHEVHSSPSFSLFANITAYRSVICSLLCRLRPAYYLPLHMCLLPLFIFPPHFLLSINFWVHYVS